MREQTGHKQCEYWQNIIPCSNISLELKQGHHKWAQRVSHFPQKRQKRYFFRSDFNTFWLTNPGLFQIRFQYILAHRAKMYWNLIWKSSGFVSFWTNLCDFCPGSVSCVCGTPGYCHVRCLTWRVGRLWPADRDRHHAKVSMCRLIAAICTRQALGINNNTTRWGHLWCP